MAFNRIEADFHGLRIRETKRVPVGTRLFLRSGAYGSEAASELFFPTPNLVEKLYYTNTDSKGLSLTSSVYFIRDQINRPTFGDVMRLRVLPFGQNYLYEQTFGDFMRGRLTYFEWKNVPEEDCKYVEADRVALTHPLVGREVMIKGSLARAKVVGGERENIFGKHTGLDPELCIQLAGKEEPETDPVSPADLFLAIEKEDQDILLRIHKEHVIRLSIQERAQMDKKGYHDDLLLLLAHEMNFRLIKSDN